MACFDLVNHQMVLSTNELREIVSALSLQVRKYLDLRDYTDEIVIQDICRDRLDVLEPLYKDLIGVYLNNFNFRLQSQSYE